MVRFGFLHFLLCISSARTAITQIHFPKKREFELESHCVPIVYFQSMLSYILSQVLISRYTKSTSVVFNTKNRHFSGVT